MGRRSCGPNEKAPLSEAFVESGGPLRPWERRAAADRAVLRGAGRRGEACAWCRSSRANRRRRFGPSTTSTAGPCTEFRPRPGRPRVGWFGRCRCDVIEHRQPVAPRSRSKSAIAGSEGGPPARAKGSSPPAYRRASLRASRRSVFTRSPGRLGTSPGAATSQAMPRSLRWRIKAKPGWPSLVCGSTGPTRQPEVVPWLVELGGAAVPPPRPLPLAACGVIRRRSREEPP